MAVWWELILNFLLGVLSQIGYILSVQFLNFSIFWQLLPVYSSWFAIQFITRNREVEDLANRFMNGFSLLWVGFQLGQYLIDNLFTDPFIIFKIFIVAGLFVYAIFVMRLTLLKRDISKYLARIGEISAINIAAMLFIQDLLIINSGLQLVELIIGFVVLYLSVDKFFEYLVELLYKKVKLPVTEEEEESKPVSTPKIKPSAPRYARITKPSVPVKPVQRVPQQVRPVQQVPQQFKPVQRSPQQVPQQFNKPVQQVFPNQPVSKPVVKKNLNNRDL